MDAILRNLIDISSRPLAKLPWKSAITLDATINFTELGHFRNQCLSPRHQNGDTFEAQSCYAIVKPHPFVWEGEFIEQREASLNIAAMGTDWMQCTMMPSRAWRRVFWHDFTDVSDKCSASNFKVVKDAKRTTKMAASCLLFDPEDGGSTFIRNACNLCRSRWFRCYATSRFESRWGHWLGVSLPWREDGNRSNIQKMLLSSY